MSEEKRKERSLALIRGLESYIMSGSYSGSIEAINFLKKLLLSYRNEFGEYPKMSIDRELLCKKDNKQAVHN